MKTSLMAAVCGLTLSFPSFAEDKLSGNEQEAANSTGASTLFDAYVPFISAEFSKEKKIGKLRYARRLKNTKKVAAFSLEFKAPLDSDEVGAEFLDFDGLGNSSSIAVGLNWDLNSSKNRPTAAGFAAQEDRCLRARGPIQERLDEGGLSNPQCTKAYLTKAIKQYHKHAEKPVLEVKDGMTTTEKDELKKKNMEHTAKLKRKLCHDAALVVGCSVEDVVNFVVAREQNLWRSEPNSAVRFLHLVVQAEYGQNSFKFRDTQSLDEVKRTEEPFKGTLGVARSWGVSSVGLSVEFLRQYQAQSERQFCLPRADPVGSFDCLASPVGAPQEEKRTLWSLEYQRIFTGWGMATSPKVSADTQNGEWALSVPIYMVGSAKGLLNGGIRFDWDSIDHDVNGTVFISKPFSLK